MSQRPIKEELLGSRAQILRSSQQVIAITLKLNRAIAMLKAEVATQLASDKEKGQASQDCEILGTISDSEI